MIVAAKIDSLDGWLAGIERDDLSDKAVATSLADFAREGIASARQHNRRALGYEPRSTIRVDGRAGVPLDSVKREIVAEFELVGAALRQIAEMLVAASPVVSGAYLKGHRLYADGREVNVPTAGDVPAAAEYVFTNLVPYARRIEIGRRADGRWFVLQVPPRVYERVAKAARSRFGNLLSIAYGFKAPIGGTIVPYGGARSRRGGDERAARAPAITVKVR